MRKQGGPLNRLVERPEDDLFTIQSPTFRDDDLLEEDFEEASAKYRSGVQKILN